MKGFFTNHKAEVFFGTMAVIGIAGLAVTAASKKKAALAEECPAEEAVEAEEGQASEDQEVQYAQEAPAYNPRSEMKNVNLDV